jgi:ribosome-binding protein aMBF1 (putative translation factor)
MSPRPTEAPKKARAVQKAEKAHQPGKTPPKTQKTPKAPKTEKAVPAAKPATARKAAALKKTEGATDVAITSEGSSRLGDRVRALRTQRRLSLRQTAQELHISPSALSMIENGTGGSSLKRLQHIANYFDVALVDLLAEPAPATPPDARFEVVRQCFATVAGVRRGKGVWYQVVSGLPTHGVQVSLITFEAGGGYAHDRLRHDGEEAHYVMLGSVVLLHGEDRVSLAQGDLVLFNAQSEHSFENASQHGPATLLSITTQAW